MALSDRLKIPRTPYEHYRSFTQCYFIEDDGDMVFYKNRHGQAMCVLALEGEIEIVSQSL